MEITRRVNANKYDLEAMTLEDLDDLLAKVRRESPTVPTLAEEEEIALAKRRIADARFEVERKIALEAQWGGMSF